MCSRALCFISLLVFLLILTGCIIWPWLHAAYTWRHSTIEYSKLFGPSLLIGSKNLMPRIIHQTYRDSESIPLNWQQASNSCRTLHPNYKYYFWTDKQAHSLVEKEFPKLLSTYDSYPYDIQRADVIRLVVLYLYGGIYLDLDIFCLKPLDKLLNYELILPKTEPVGLSNDVIMSKPGHPFLLQVLNDLPKNNRMLLTKYPTVMFSTGPMYLTHEASSYLNRSSLEILSPELYGKYSSNSSHALFRHLKASSWHGRDAMMVKSIYRWKFILLTVLLLILIMTFIIIDITQQCHLTMKFNYKNYLALPSYLRNSKQEEQPDVNKKYFPILLITFSIFCCFFFVLNKNFHSSLIDHGDASS